MDLDTKTIVIIALVVVGLFAGGLSYVYYESNNREVALDLVRKYLDTEDNVQRNLLAASINSHVNKKSFALTTRASFESFDSLIGLAKRCDNYAKEKSFNPRDNEHHFLETWKYCMNNSEVLENK